MIIISASRDRDYFSYTRADRLIGEFPAEIPDERSVRPQEKGEREKKKEKRKDVHAFESRCAKNPENTSEPTTDQWRKKERGKS